MGLAEVEPDSIGGDMWTFTAVPGRQLVALPLEIDPGGIAEPVELVAPPIGIATGRFLAWVIPTQEQVDAALAQLDDGQADGGGDDLLLRDGNDFDLGGERVGDARRGADDEVAGAMDAVAGVVGQGGVPLDPELLIPRVSRRATVYSDGRIGWRLERSLAGATMADGEEPYMLKVRADRLNALTPPRPERVVREAGEDSRAFRFRELAVQQEYREQVEAFRTLRELVLALPDRFEQPMPAFVWAVYDVPLFSPTFGIDGPPPLPWSVPANAWTDLRELGAMRGASNADGVAIEALTLVDDLVPLADSGDAFSGRMLAQALSLSGVIPGAAFGDPVYEAASELLRKGDGVAMQRVLADVVAVVPPTSASLALLRDATDRLTPTQRLASLRVEFAAAAEDPAGVASAVQSVSAMLRDDQGPPPSDVLAVVMQGADGTPAAQAVGRLPVAQLQGERWTDAVAFLTMSAGSSESAAAMMRDGVLRATPADKLAEALRLIAEQPDAVEAAPGAAVPIGSTQHPILIWLTAPAGEVRAAAWAALPRFVVRIDPADASTEDAATVLTAVVEAIDPSAPAEAEGAAAFFADQPYAEAEALAALMALTGRVANPAPLAAPAIGSGGALGEAMAAAPTESRAAFADAVLAASGQPFAGIGGVLASPSQGPTLSRWFGSAVAEGRVPSPAQLADQLGEDDLLDLAASGEPMIRDAAAAGLAALAGGQPGDVPTVKSRLDNAADRTKSSLQAAWLPSRQELNARRLMETKGAYRVLVRLPGDREPRVIGVVELGLDGRERVAFAGVPIMMSIPDDRLAIRIDTVSELRNLGDRELNALPLERVGEPLDLLSREGGGWGGSVEVAGEGDLEVVIEPL
ncbi:MAG: hypothetical protein AAGK09_13565 [Planctomycetota bacterium]